ncbi:hypothetical protein RP29_14725 [Acidovorax temperans]|uniref:Uncharacterized protein n=1 Tax=Acidovorax temperans TaxID=80878 RepID=A0A0D7K9J1_9BURK|nr:hypothetical protein RP29_14725 [Acidovorax temperans]
MLVKVIIKAAQLLLAGLALRLWGAVVELLRVGVVAPQVVLPARRGLHVGVVVKVLVRQAIDPAVARSPTP